MDRWTHFEPALSDDGETDDEIARQTGGPVSIAPKVLIYVGEDT